LTAVLFSGACAPDASSVALRINTKKGLLDDVSAELRVIDAAEAKCENGFVTPENPPSDAVQTFSLSSDCQGGAKLCAEITLEKDGDDRIFEVIARRAGAVRARGCTVKAVDQDPLEVSISVVPNLPPKCCNDGVLQAGEQCDDAIAAATDCGGNPVDPTPGSCGGVTTSYMCECDCLARELLASEPGASPPLNNDPNTKIDVALAFSGPSGSADVANSLRAVFTDLSTAPDAATAPNINVRTLTGSLFPIVGTALAQQLRLKPSCDGNQIIAGQGLTRSQGQPDIARVSDDRLAVVFQDDNETGNPAGNFSIHLIQLNGTGCGEPTNTKVNFAKTGSLSLPRIARGPNGNALVVWVDGSTLKGRIWNTNADATCSTCLPAMADLDLGTAKQGERPAVAGNANGWVLAYTGPGTEGDIFTRTVDPTGNVGAEKIVNLDPVGLQGEASVAMLADGRFVVVWSNVGAITFQRFDATGQPVAGDQDQSLIVSSPLGGKTAVAAGDDSGGFFTAVWQSGNDGTIWARLIGGSEGFLINSVTGTFDDFLASHPGIAGQRVNPDVAIGGDGFIAIGWTDLAPTNAGVRLRRFPLPSALVQ
jgi:hypothetical protein